MTTPTPHPQGPRQRSTPPPSSIADLVARAMDGLWDDTKELKHFLRLAEKYRREGKEYYEKGDLENAFVYFAKAATLVLDKIPTHRDYDVKLKPMHKNNLGLNGQDILDNLTAIKPIILERYHNYQQSQQQQQQQQQQPSSTSSIYAPAPAPTPAPAAAAPSAYVSSTPNRSRSTSTRDRDRGLDRTRIDRDQRAYVDDEVARWRAGQEKEWEEQERERERRGRRSGSAASGAPGGVGSGYTMVASGGEEETRRLYEDMRRREAEFRASQDVKRREEDREREREKERRKKEEKARRKREEEEGILRRQREAEDAARLARQAPPPAASAPPAVAATQQNTSLTSLASQSMASISTNGSSPSSMFGQAHTPTSSLATTPSGSMYGSLYAPTQSQPQPQPQASGSGSGGYRPPSNNSSPYPPPPASAPPPALNGSGSGFPPPPLSAPGGGSGFSSIYASSQTSSTPTPSSTSPYPYGNANTNASTRQSDTTPTTAAVHPLPPLPVSMNGTMGMGMGMAAMPPPPQSAPVYGSQQPPGYPYAYRPPTQPQGAPESSIYTIGPQQAGQQAQQAFQPPQQQQQQPPQQQQQQQPQVHAPQARSRPPSFLGDGSISFLPLESPTKYEGDSTDSESLVGGKSGWRKKHHDQLKTPTRSSSISGPAPETTTSPPPADGRPIEYPRLMSPHQLKQGYTPSLNSMFSPLDSSMSMMSLGSDTLLFDSRAGGSGSMLYPREALPVQSAPVGYGMYGMQQAPPPQHQQQQQQQFHHQRPSPNNRPPLPHPPNQQPQYHYQQQGQQDTVPTLKTVSLPRDCLPRFLSIAKVNTSLNKETCGLLLGRDKGNRYVVTTLLVPKQHATSDTCTMDEEELVMQFTEERNLITLGWIHTHPSQSCFMSSVDLHTHSGFQRMLPESFAVVCAPKFNPNFGIFRLTDPPGLKTVLDCKAKEAFHPHPDVPIYTDADKGHVQMRDLPLEIVDIR